MLPSVSDRIPLCAPRFSPYPFCLVGALFPFYGLLVKAGGVLEKFDSSTDLSMFS
jgi:hypothetical protein